MSFFDLQFQDSVYKYLASGVGISSLEADRLHEACQHLIGHLEVGQGDQNQDCDYIQVIPSVVVISTCACKLFKFFPEGNKSIKCFICLVNLHRIGSRV